MTGLCDLHCHLLHGLDDGAKTLDETLEMARALVDLGFSTIAPSPHNRPEYATREVALKRLAEVQDELRAAEIPLSLAPNSENFLLDERFVSGLGTEEARLVGKGPFVLVEAPYSAPVPMLTEMIFRIKLKGITPLLAHPERCYEFERLGRAAEAVRAGNDPATVRGVHVCGLATTLTPALLRDLEDFGRSLIMGPGGGLGWS